MPIFYTGNDTDGVSVTANGQFWITQVNELISNGNFTFNFGAFSNNTFVVEGKVATTASIGDAVVGSGNYNTVIVKEDASIKGGSDGIFLTGNSHFVVNHGLIKGNVDEGVQFNNDGASLVNHGKIVGGFAGLYNLGDAGAFYNGEDGVIKGGGFGVYFGAGGGGAHLENDGLIKGDIGINAFNGTHQIVNNGKIEGTGGTAIQGDGGVQNIYNSGDIIGDVDLGAGNDSYDGRGSGKVDGKVYGEAGIDVLRGGKRDDKLDGGTENDTIYGGKGNDRLWGDAGGDYINGGKGNDRIWGGTESDILQGGKGNDTIKGGDGIDYLYGEQGNDKLFGGAGADLFIFYKGKEGRDKIKDWEDGSDQILLAYGITNTTRFLNKAVSTDGADVLIDLSFADNAGGDTAEGIIRILGAAGDIGATDFVFA